jgi:hypothetical protein
MVQVKMVAFILGGVIINSVPVTSPSEQTFSIYPNPTNGICTIQSNSQRLSSNSRIEIYNVVGEKIYSSNPFFFTNSQIDLSKQPDGIYFVNLKTEERNEIKKIVITH